MSKSTRNTGEPWVRAGVQALRELAALNTPTPFIGLKLSRTRAAVQTRAFQEGISLKPTNRAPYNGQKKWRQARREFCRERACY